MSNIWKTVIAGVLLTALSYGLAILFGWTTPDQLSWLEILAVGTSYTCTLMCVYQTRWNYPVGILTTLLYSILFYQWEMYGVSIFNLYLVFSLTYGWFRWGPDEVTRPVTKIKTYTTDGLVYWVFGFLVLSLLWFIQWLFQFEMTTIEIWITVLSGVAQLLLDNKKLENWYVWAVVNILSIFFYYQGGLYLVTLQYVFFLGNTVFGYIMWRKAWQEV